MSGKRDSKLVFHEYDVIDIDTPGPWKGRRGSRVMSPYLRKKAVPWTAFSVSGKRDSNP